MDDQTITRYLLGESSAEEKNHIEERYFSDSDLLDYVLTIEDDLIDAYLRHELTPPERERFETYFLASPERRERLEIAQTLIACVNQQSESGPHLSPSAAASAREQVSWTTTFLDWLRIGRPALQYTLAALLLATILGGLWRVIDRWHQPTEVHQAQIEHTYPEQGQRPQPQGPGGIQEREGQTQNDQPSPQRAEVLPAPTGPTNQKPSEPSKQPSSQTSMQPQPVIASFILTPGLTRDVEDTNKLVIPLGAQFVKLQLNIESTGEYKAYRASIQRVGAGEIWRRTFPKSLATARKEALTIKLPAGLFADGEYLLTLTGATATGEPEIVGDYPFRVSKQR